METNIESLTWVTSSACRWFMSLTFKRTKCICMCGNWHGCKGFSCLLVGNAIALFCNRGSNTLKNLSMVMVDTHFMVYEYIFLKNKKGPMCRCLGNITLSGQ